MAKGKKTTEDKELDLVNEFLDKNLTNSEAWNRTFLKCLLYTTIRLHVGLIGRTRTLELISGVIAFSDLMGDEL